MCLFCFRRYVRFRELPEAALRQGFAVGVKYVIEAYEAYVRFRMPIKTRRLKRLIVRETRSGQSPLSLSISLCSLNIPASRAEDFHSSPSPEVGTWVVG